MSFIDTVKASDAKEDVLAMYQREENHWGYVPNYAKLFCYRPALMERWGRLVAELKRPVDGRRYELVTFAAAYALKHSSCSMAHGNLLAKIIGKQALLALTRGEISGDLTAAEMAIFKFSAAVAKDASAITQADVTLLKNEYQLCDEDIFDIVSIAAGRSFFTKILDGLGSLPDSSFNQLDSELISALTIGRPISQLSVEHTKSERAS
ncbi:hypothetical protein [Paraglaciecola hydrolytica]|uniref:Peroxidase n=1 Tax=Paraglaciecola hydrolytica TaxID=1799789 RepID=A0A136A763_9ALTE|nr:hypothetical protein [Paraglaciecola hydrolytica]KXI30970.1 hypothetical protein AX660_00460 [Paraglaciecola hydrolytica]